MHSYIYSQSYSRHKLTIILTLILTLIHLLQWRTLEHEHTVMITHTHTHTAQKIFLVVYCSVYLYTLYGDVFALNSQFVTFVSFSHLLRCFVCTHTQTLTYLHIQTYHTCSHKSRVYVAHPFTFMTL